VQVDCGSYSCAIRGKSHAFVYISTGNKTTIHLGVISGKVVKAMWFDPRSGKTTSIGEFKNSGEESFEVPGMSKELARLKSGRGCDWVLVLESIH
jgi:Putative collagen-binding domain of a collagenase